MQKKIVKEILEWLGCILIAVILALLVRYFIGTPTVVNQTSMSPTLKDGERLILNRWIRTTKGTFKRGDIITFESPSKKSFSINEVNLENPISVYDNEDEGILFGFSYYVLEIGKKSYIKRVIGLPGEHLKIANGKVYVNDEELREDYLQQEVVTPEKTFNDIIVPEGYVFVMGDNRNGSIDSRELGCIPIEKIESKVLIRFLPLNLFGKIN